MLRNRCHTALEKQALSCKCSAHPELESIIIITLIIMLISMIIIVVVIVAIVIIVFACKQVADIHAEWL